MFLQQLVGCCLPGDEEGVVWLLQEHWSEVLWRNETVLQRRKCFFNDFFEKQRKLIIRSTEDNRRIALHQGLEGIGDTEPIQPNLLIGPHDVGAGSLDLVGQALRSEEVSYGVGLEALDLYQALSDQPLHQDVDTTQRDSNVLTELSLGSIRVLVDVGENGEFLCGFVLDHVYSVQFLNLIGS